MIPSFNCSSYLVETIQSVLRQDAGPELMQIAVIDDCSTDTDVEALVNRHGGGRVEFFRQPQNVGSLRNFETCLNRSTGIYIHILHGDDQVRPGFYTEIQKLFEDFPDAGAAFTGFVFIDELNRRLYDNHFLLDKPGLLKNQLMVLARSQMIQAPAMVVKRSVYETLGSFYAVHYGEDWEMWVRIAARYPIAHSPERLALYRVHDTNITGRYFMSGQSLTDAIKVVDIMQNYIPVKDRPKAKRLAYKHLALYFARTSDKVYHQFFKPYIALEQAKRAMGLHFSPVTFFYWLKIRSKILMGYKLQKDKKWLFHPINFFR